MLSSDPGTLFLDTLSDDHSGNASAKLFSPSKVTCSSLTSALRGSEGQYTCVSICFDHISIASRAAALFSVHQRNVSSGRYMTHGQNTARMVHQEDMLLCLSRDWPNHRQLCFGHVSVHIEHVVSLALQYRVWGQTTLFAGVGPYADGLVVATTAGGLLGEILRQISIPRNAFAKEVSAKTRSPSVPATQHLSISKGQNKCNYLVLTIWGARVHHSGRFLWTITTRREATSEDVRCPLNGPSKGTI